MIASDYSSDDSMSLSAPELVPAQVIRGYDSTHDSSAGSSEKLDSPLKRAIKENETSIIQSILSPPSLTTTSTSTGNKNSNNSNLKSDKTTSTISSDGLPPLLDYLFEDGQLTRIEYDIVDKGYGATSTVEQVQVLLRILLESKDDGALESLLVCLKKLHSSSDTIHKLCEQFLPGIRENIKTVVFRNEIKTEETASATTKKDDKNARAPTKQGFSPGKKENIRSKKLHDFYYGKGQVYKLYYNLYGESGENRAEHDEANKNTTTRKWSTQQLNKSGATIDSVDYRDFYLTNGCLETIRNLILDNSKESITAVGWEKVLRNMNGLLSTDVLSIKDLLFQIKTLEHQRVLEAETKIKKAVRKVYKQRRKLHQEKQQRESTGESEWDRNENASKIYADVDDNNVKDGCTGERIDTKQECNINWNQVIYHSLQVWKQRNGTNSTFYSLVGIFQHSNLNRTADLLLECKQEIQLRENEKEIAEGSVIDVNNGTRTSATSTMLEKSDFLRKFYTPSRRSDNNGNFNAGLSTTKDRVSASPVLSLDLL